METEGEGGRREVEEGQGKEREKWRGKGRRGEKFDRSQFILLGFVMQKLKYLVFTRNKKQLKTNKFKFAESCSNSVN